MIRLPLMPLARVVLARAKACPGEPAIPDYGSDEWADLEADDPCKLAAVFIAAEAHRAYWCEAAVRERLTRELAAEDVRVAQRYRRTSDDVHVLPVTSWPPYAELARRRKGE